MTTSPRQKMQDLLQDFKTAMLVSRTSSGQLRSRPMQIAEIEDDGTVWLMTDRHSAKIQEIERDHQVNLVLQTSMKFVSLSGLATMVEDRDRVARLWNEAWKVWFPGGKDDPNLILLQIRSDAGEYWDNSGMSGLRYLVEAGRAYFTGTRPDVAGDPRVHGKVDL
ncbi:MAG: pyridoxamine 5'-phosphate oxidase family protein [Planctomycetaceae bacterium]|nr:pyridoxamine 5'-phosphate oxidase family protein [Planctomycetaceae bacterium]